MFMWLMKQLLNIRKILDGRKHPHQLAWGLAFGFLVGIVPHGNLLAIALIALVLSLRVNHSLAALTGVTVALLATNLDPLTHQIGQFVLNDPRWHNSLTLVWEWPLMPWTDLNNTVVAGSLILGVSMVLPLYAISYPIFRYIQPAAEEGSAMAEQLTAEVIEPTVEWSDAEIPVAEPVDATPTEVEPPVDVIRFTECDNESDSRTDPNAANEIQMNQALGYLLRRLRDSQRGDVA